MSTTEIRSDDAAPVTPDPTTFDMTLDVVVIPVSDVDRAMARYRQPGWRFDGNIRDGDTSHGIQYTPKGSGGSIQLGTGEPDADWPEWYAEYMVREQSGAELPR